jgi:FlgD Ig-like domain/Beta-propeller repeat
MSTRSALLAAALLTSLFTPLPAPAETPIQLPPGSGFVANQGQAPADVRYYAAVPGGALYLTPDALILDSWRAERTESKARAGDEQSVRRVGQVVWMRFAEKNPAAILDGLERHDAHLNFFLGKDSSKWHAGVPVFGQATYRDLWPGVDLTFTSGAHGVSCALNPSAGANVDQARFEVVTGDVTSTEIVDVAAVSALLAGGAAVEVLDDPNALVWSTYLGGSAEELGWSATFDSNGNPVVTGLNTSTFFPTTPGAYDRIYSGLGDVFVSKLSADGSTLIWSTFLGGSSLLLDYGYSVSLDPSNNPVVTGYTRSEDFPTTPGAYDTEYNGDADVFVSMLSANGSALLWSTFIGGPQHDIGYDIDHDSEGNPVVAGRTLSVDFPTTAGAYDPSQNGEEDGFILKLSGLGNALLWSTFLGGSLYDGVQSVEVDGSAMSLVCGYTASTDFPGGAADGLYDIFVAKLSVSGDILAWSRLIGGSSYDYGTDLALDSAGNPVICGSTGSFDFPVTPGAYDETYNGDDDVIAAKMSSANGATVWATFVGGTTPVYEIAHGVVVDGQDRPILAGTTPSGDFPTTPGGYDTSHNGGGDVFVVRLNAAGSVLEWGSFFGGPGEDYAYALARSPAGDVVVTGQCDNGYPVTAGAFDVMYNGDIADVFISKVAVGATSGVEGGSPAVNPLSLAIHPNPIATTARIAFTLPEAASPRIDVFDATGRLCSVIQGAALVPGAHTLDWNAVDRSGRALPSGVYAVRLTAADRVESRRVVLIR